MLTSTLYAILLGSQSDTTWNSGNLKVEVSQANSQYKLFINDSTEVLRSQNIESIAYVLSKKNQLTITGNKHGLRFISDFTSVNDHQIRVTTSFFAQPGTTKNELLDQFELVLPSAETLHRGGPSPKWATPILFSTNNQFQVSVSPDLAKFDLIRPMTGYLGTNGIGYKSFSPDKDGNWSEVTTSRQIPSQVTFSYMINAKTSLANGFSEALSEVWTGNSARYRTQAFPQQSPFIIAAGNTYRFARLSVAAPVGQENPVQKETPKRWVSLDLPSNRVELQASEAGTPLLTRIGFPADQMNTVFLNNYQNAVRSAAAMYSWGNYKKQTGWKDYANELLNLICLYSPTNGFDSSIIVEEELLPERDSRELTFDSTVDEAATAFYALQFVSEFPDHILAQPLNRRIAGVLNRLPQGTPEPEQAALIASVSVLPNISPLVKQAAVEHQIRIQTSFEISSKQIENPWTLEALYWLVQAHPGQYESQTQQVVNTFLLNQSMTDIRETDQLAYFGSFRNLRGELSGDNATLASSIGRLGILLNKPEWLDRAGFALRASHSLYETNLGLLSTDLDPYQELGTSSPGFGNVLPNHPDPRINFEGAEGLLNAATWELTSKTFGAYVFENGGSVGIDGIISDLNGNLYNAMLGNPTPYSKHFQAEIKKANTPGVTPSNELPAIPTLISLLVELRGNDWFIIANPGLTLSTSNEQSSLEFDIDGVKLNASKGSKGFESKISVLTPPKRVLATGKAGEFPLQIQSQLPEGSPLTWAPTSLNYWYRSGDYRWIGLANFSAQGSQWLSSGDLGKGIEENWAMGQFFTPWLTANGKSLEFTGFGVGDCQIVLIDEQSKTILETWIPDEKVSKVKFDISPIQGRRVRLAIIDNDSQGFVRMKDLKVTD